MKFPKIYLAVDNCFASKRWTLPSEWVALARQSGLEYIEASADNECDPMYSDPRYIQDWLKAVKSECLKQGTKISTFYSGHGTYATLGLAHSDPRYANRFVEEWMFPLIDYAAELSSGAGFFCHAFKESLLQDVDAYNVALTEFYRNLARIAAYSKAKGVILSIEQMYTPHQYPWRLEDCDNILRHFKSLDTPLYITIDVGHQFGQRRFLRPDKDAILRSIREKTPIYAGPLAAYDLLCEAIASRSDSDSTAEKILQQSDGYDHLFAKTEDTDIYGWLRKYGCYSPVIHLQQTDNTSSSHGDFTAQNNAKGLIHPMKVLEAVYESYMIPDDNGMPPRLDEIYLTLEQFYGTAEYNFNILNSLAESVAYWRKAIPQDGIYLDELIARSGCSTPS